MLLESVLATIPGDPLTLYWLGQAYNKSGLSTTTMELWSDALAGDQPSSYLEARLELYSAITRANQRPVAGRYVESRAIANDSRQAPLFLRPSWISTLPNGSMLLVANGSNEILRINANGLIVEKFNGGVSGFDRPFGLSFMADGRMVISEFTPNRITFLSESGQIANYAPIARPTERIIGPQYLTTDNADFIYVSDVGRARVVKLDAQGNFIQAFNGQSSDFQGLRLPTGVAILRDQLYVADAGLHSILVFDLYGNLLDQVLPGQLVRPEGLNVVAGQLLIADTSRILLFDPASGSLRELYRTAESNPRLICANIDANGDLVVVDYNSSQIMLLADPVTIYAGLYLDVQNVYANNFPDLQIDVQVLDTYGRPVIGLSELNFYLSEIVRTTETNRPDSSGIRFVRESIRSISGFRLSGSLDETTAIDNVFLLEGSGEMQANRVLIRNQLVNLQASLGGATTTNRLVIAKATPQPATAGTLQAMTAAILAMQPDTTWRFDSGLRLAANELTGSANHRSIIYISSGSINEDLLTDLTLIDLASLLVANRISLHVLHIGMKPITDALQFLVEKTGGSIMRDNDPESLVGLAARITGRPSGVYRLAFSSMADPGFGRSFLPLRVEVYFRAKSGKVETGYFTPLQ